MSGSTLGSFLDWLEIVFLSVLVCVIYGVLHDQITARICVEYFTIGHVPIFQIKDPTVLGLCWGILATWWVGVIMGIPLGWAARLGNFWPKLDAKFLARPLFKLSVGIFVFAGLSGFVGFIAANNGWTNLDSPLAARVPAEKHVLFLVDMWAHRASYMGGCIGGTGLICWVIIRRMKLARESTIASCPPL